MTVDRGAPWTCVLHGHSTDDARRPWTVDDRAPYGGVTDSTVATAPRRLSPPASGHDPRGGRRWFNEHPTRECVMLPSNGTLLERSADMFRLTPRPRYRLLRPPLLQAVAQVRYPLRARLQTLDGVVPVQDRLDRLFPYMTEQQVQQLSILVSPGASAQAEHQASRLWRFTNDDGWSLALAADSATLSVGPQYQAFEDFAERFNTVLRALVETGEVTRCDRLGVRYINIAEAPPAAPMDWKEWFRAELTGWSATDVVGQDARLVTSLTQTQLAARPVGDLSGAPVDVQGIIRHGYIPPNTTVPGILPIQPQGAAFLLDMDLFVEAPQPFDPEALTTQVNLLHGQIDLFFRWALAPGGEAYFGVEEQA